MPKPKKKIVGKKEKGGIAKVEIAPVQKIITNL